MKKRQVGFAEQHIRTALTDPAADHATRISWKYACTSNSCDIGEKRNPHKPNFFLSSSIHWETGGISGTPTYLVNGVTISGCATWDFKRWKQVSLPHPLLNHYFF